MSAFTPAYEIVRRNEAGYANNPNDRGGETYAGIARNYWPNWSGWAYIDAQKSVSREPKWYEFTIPSVYLNETREIAWNTKFPELDTQVKTFYLERWNASNAGKINDQRIANVYFDFYILYSKAARVLQETLRKYGKNVTVDNVAGSSTMNAVNSIRDVTGFISDFVDARIAAHSKEIGLDPVKQEFRSQWIARAEMFRPGLVNDLFATLQVDKRIGFAVAGIAAAGATWYFIQSHHQS